MYLKRYNHIDTEMVEQSLGKWVEFGDYDIINRFQYNRLEIVKKDLNRSLVLIKNLKKEIDWYRIIIGTEIVLGVIAGIIQVVRVYS